jgi:hypothetical protein
VLGGAANAWISWRLRTAQTGALREHGIHPSGIPVGRTFAIGHHHRIFNLRLPLTF